MLFTHELKKHNLNDLDPLKDLWNDSDGCPDGVGDNSVIDSERETQVYFRNLEEHLIGHIKESCGAVGAIAWLTNGNILDALATLEDCAIVVQKEDFLRPDYANTVKDSNWRNWLRRKYDALKPTNPYSHQANMISSLSVCYGWCNHAVRCVGNHNSTKTPAFPRMHNKFLIVSKQRDFDKMLEAYPGLSDALEYCDLFLPTGVWTGSFNFTKNAGYSLENAIYTTDPEVVMAYYEEFGQIMAFSEPLDWSRDWIAPELRIGT